MNKFNNVKSHFRVKLIAAGIIVLWMLTGCSGFTPYQPRDHREEGPQQGIFTGHSGEFVIEPGKAVDKQFKVSY